MKFISALLLISITIIACKTDHKTTETQAASVVITERATATLGDKILTRILPPDGFDMVIGEVASYAQYLQSLPLKPIGSPIRYYDGRTKSHFSEYVAVIDLPIGTKDLHQCADAVMRLRADYLWHSSQFDKIHFNFTNGMRVDYSNWMKGKRIKVNGNNTDWYQAQDPSNSKEDYWNYLEQIWMYAGTLSLSKELKTRKIENVQIGDVFIQGGSPGHAISIVNMAINNSTGEKLLLLAQSYMPAQEIHILSNPYNDRLSPWYTTKDLNQLHTPEWTFNVNDLKYFKY